MAKEIPIITSDLIYNWTFQDNESVTNNLRAKSVVNGNPTYNDGVATFNGSTDYYKLKTLINLGTKHTIELKLKISGLTGNPRILSKDSQNCIFIEAITNKVYYRCSNIIISSIDNSIPVNTWVTLSICRNGSSLIIYVNGSVILSTTYNSTVNFIFDKIGWDDLNGKFNGQLEYIKIWNRQLSPSEVKNNYNGKTYRALPYKPTTLFNINSDNGVIRDLTGKATPVATNVQLPKIGSNINVMKFNGLSGNVNIGSQALVGDITFMGWVNNINRGENLEARLISNSQLYIRHTTGSNKFLVFSRNNGWNVSTSAFNSFKESSTQFICITSTSTGITNLYIGNKNNPPTLSGAANQSAGTPIAGTTCYLGNNSTDDRTLNGWIGDARMDASILTLEEITNFWSNTRGGY